MKNYRKNMPHTNTDLSGIDLYPLLQLNILQCAYNTT